MKQEILLIAAVSRLLDLHDTRHEWGTDAPSIPKPADPLPQAAYFVTTGLLILKVLQQLENDEGHGFKSKTKVIDEVRKQLPTTDSVDIDFCIRFLSLERSINYIIVEDGIGTDRQGATKETALIERASGFSQIRLTKTARFLLSGVRYEDFLYDDKDAEKIIVAIERGDFEAVIRFCKEISESITMLIQKIVRAGELPTQDAMRAEFIKQHLFYKETLSRTFTAAKRAQELTEASHIVEKFNTWKIENNIDFQLEISNIQSEIRDKIVCKIENAVRKLTEFIEKTAKGNSNSIGVIEFQNIALQFAKRPIDDTTRMLDFLEQTSWSSYDEPFFYAFDFTGSVDFSEYALKENVPPISFSVSDKPSLHDAFRSFIDKYGDILLKKLAEGPLSLADLFTEFSSVIEIDEDASYSDLFGLYQLPDCVDHLLVVDDRGDMFKFVDEDNIYHGSNPYLMLIKKEDTYELQ